MSEPELSALEIATIALWFIEDGEPVESACRMVDLPSAQFVETIMSDVETAARYMHFVMTQRMIKVEELRAIDAQLADAARYQHVLGHHLNQMNIPDCTSSH